MIDEVIIAVPRDVIKDLLDEQPFGFIDQNLIKLYTLILNNTISINRLTAETDETFKQLIPYVLIKNQSNYLLTKRNKKQTEVRLHDKMSIGLGGHINPVDSSEKFDLIIGGLFREIQEEISITDFAYPQFIGFINDDISEVGRVHLGLLFEIETKSSTLDIVEKDKMEGNWASLTDIEASYEHLESWSKIAFDAHLRRNIPIQG